MSSHTDPFALPSDPFALPSMNPSASPNVNKPPHVNKPPNSSTQGTSPSYQVTGISNRLRAVLLHLPFYGFESTARLARDTGLAPSTISRIIRGKVSPSYVVVEIITRAISHRLGRPLDARELFSTNGTYPTPLTCELMNCLGCLPPEAWCESTDTLRPRWRRKKPGDWCLYNEGPTQLDDTQKPGGGSATKLVPSAPEVNL